MTKKQKIFKEMIKATKENPLIKFNIVCDNCGKILKYNLELKKEIYVKIIPCKYCMNTLGEFYKRRKNEE